MGVYTLCSTNKPTIKTEVVRLCYRTPPPSWFSLELLSWWQAPVLWFGQDFLYLGTQFEELKPATFREEISAMMTDSCSVIRTASKTYQRPRFSTEPSCGIFLRGREEYRHVSTLHTGLGDTSQLRPRLSCSASST